MDGKVAVITGASGGIGARTARTLAAEGAAVVLMARRQERLELVAEQIRQKGGRVTIKVGDVTDPEQCKQLMQLAVDTYGSLDALVNNAGTMDFHMSAVNVSDELWDHVLQMDLTSRVYCCRAALPYMAAQGRGSIVNLGSIAGHYGHGGISTSAAFAAIEGITKNLAIQYSRKGIRCNAVCPGPTQHDPEFDIPTKYEFAPTEKKPEEADFVEVVGRHRDWIEAQGQEQANVILFLLSDESSAVTGQCIVTDHGMCL
jgi:NAD(P)-dependent dehydrogenase (short-subunit alcohol dehydrogenase family)